MGSFWSLSLKDLHFKSALAFGVPGVVGVLCSRRILLPSVPDHLILFGKNFSKDSLLLVLFSALMLAASYSMIRAARKPVPLTKGTPQPHESSLLTLAFIGAIVGVIAGFVGAGGGFLIVPVLVSFAKLEMRQAVGTSLFVISLQSLLGVLGDRAALATIDLCLFVSVATLAVLGMSLGTRLRRRISPPHLKLGFGVFVLVMGTVILLRELR